MSRNGGWDNDRFEHGYFEVESVFVPVQTMVINPIINDAITGRSSNGVEYFADVAFNGIPLPNVDEILIQRSIENVTGTVHIGFHTGASSIDGLRTGAEIIVTTGVRHGGISASQRRFFGRVNSVVFPSKGDTRATIDGFDNGNVLAITPPTAGTMTGDVLTWITNQCGTIDMGTGFQVIAKTPAINIPILSPLSYNDLSLAVKTLASAYRTNYAFFNGNNELIILDPTTVSAETPSFTLYDNCITKYQEVVMGNQRYNRVAYSNYTGNSSGLVYWSVSLSTSGDRAFFSSSAGAGNISGVYNDAEDQAINPIAANPGYSNNLCQNDTQLQAACASLCYESQRQRLAATTGYNPFIDIGAVLQYGSQKMFISKITDRIAAGSLWASELEVRAA